MTKEIELTKGYKALVNDEDFEYLSQFKWSTDPLGYAIRYKLVNKKIVRIRMHRVILERVLERPLTSDEEPDHIDHNPRNNTRQNLRVSTHQQNMRNRTKVKTPTASRFKGVYRSKGAKKWSAYIKINGKLHFLGQFDNEELAAKAYDAAAREHFGEFANLNFPDEQYTLSQILKERSRGYSRPTI